MLLVQEVKDSSRSVKIWWICNRKFDKRKILLNTGFVELPEICVNYAKLDGYHHSGFLRDSS